MPPFGSGLARAYTADEAKQLEALLAELEPRVRSLLGSDRAPASVWLTDQQDIHGASALTLDQLIVICAEVKPHLRTVVAHELAHWHTFIAGLPYVIEEGLAVYVEKHLGVSHPVVERVDPNADWNRILEIDRTAWARIKNPAEIDTFYLFGYWLVEQIGLPELRRMEDQNRTTPKDVLCAAGLPVYD